MAGKRKWSVEEENFIIEHFDIWNKMRKKKFSKFFPQNFPEKKISYTPHANFGGRENFFFINFIPCIKIYTPGN